MRLDDKDVITALISSRTSSNESKLNRSGICRFNSHHQRLLGKSELTGLEVIHSDNFSLLNIPCG